MRTLTLSDAIDLGHGTYRKYLKSEMVATLRQSRTEMSYEGIENLKSSIRESGQRNEGNVYAFEAKEARHYLEKINQTWGTSYELSQFKPVYIPEKGRRFYLFLVAGHRRLRACSEVGVDYLAKIEFGRTFLQAIKWQLEENFHEDVSDLDKVASANALWLMMKKENPKLTLREFARKHVHRSESWLRNALRFARLPLSIQNLIKKTGVKRGTTNYSVLVEIAKLYDHSVQREKPLEAKYLNALLNHIFANQFKLGDVKDFCEQEMRAINGQEQLFDLASSEQVNRVSLSIIRRTLTEKLAADAQYANAALAVVQELTATGQGYAKQAVQQGNLALSAIKKA